MDESPGDSPLTFEGSFRLLQETIERLEHGNLPLSEAVNTFEAAMTLANQCTAILETAELRVTRVVEGQTSVDESSS